jgi:medium-chain acyl-[acyl-carrier-protein] hydrolase
VIQQPVSTNSRRVDAGPTGGEQARWVIRPIERPDATLRLFCLSHAGGGASAFRGWAEMVPQEVELLAVQLPGRESRLREPCVTRLADVVAGVLSGFERLLDRPFALFGHSLGALLAFETARRLIKDGGPAPLHLFVSGRRAPHLPRQHAPIAHLERDPFIEQVTRRYGGIPPQILQEPELLDLLLPALRGDMVLLEAYTYRTGSPLSCPITAYAGADDPEAGVDELTAWREHTVGAFNLRRFPGSHFFLQSSRGALLADVSATLMALVTDVQRVKEPGR